MIAGNDQLPIQPTRATPGSGHPEIWARPMYSVLK